MFILFFILSLLPTTLVSGLRYGIGTDYFYTYYPNFKDALTHCEYTEKPFIWLNQLLRLMTDDPVWLFLLMAALFTGFSYGAILRMSDNWICSAILVFACSFFFVSLNQSRQMVGVAIIMFACTFLVEKKPIPFIIFVLLASCFHLACLLFLPMYLLNLKFIKKYWLFVGIPLVVLSPFLQKIIYELISLTKYSYYFERPEYNTGQYMWAYFNGTLAVEIIGLLYYKRLYKFFDIKAVMLLAFNTIALFFACLCFFITVPELFTRLLLMFSWSQIFLIPMIFKVEDFKLSLIINILFICILLHSSLFIVCYQQHHEIFPYKSIFTK